ncbi:SGNH-hydro domain-containing protein [Chitinophaga sp. 180180018-2]|nr:SGNH-hydro domain-containing protein [Chitinophaga sp. 212800010-3]
MLKILFYVPQLHVAMKNNFIVVCLALLLPGLTNAQLRKANIIFIGNSITQGAGLPHPLQEAPPVRAAEWLKQAMPAVTFDFSNQGVSGSTTVDFLPATNRLFNNVIKAADVFKQTKDATLVFSMVLGTNDSAIEGPNGAPVSPENYRTNVTTIVDKLLAAYPGCIVILHHPIWYSPNTHNGARYLAEGLARLQTYYPVLNNIVAAYHRSHPGQVFTGYTGGFRYFKKHPELFAQEHGKSGIFQLHPNVEGATALGNDWAKAIKDVLSRLK